MSKRPADDTFKPEHNAPYKALRLLKGKLVMIRPDVQRKQPNLPSSAGTVKTVHRDGCMAIVNLEMPGHLFRDRWRIADPQERYEDVTGKIKGLDAGSFMAAWGVSSQPGPALPRAEPLRDVLPKFKLLQSASNVPPALLEPDTPPVGWLQFFLACRLHPFEQHRIFEATVGQHRFRSDDSAVVATAQLLQGRQDHLQHTRAP